MLLYTPEKLLFNSYNQDRFCRLGLCSSFVYNPLTVLSSLSKQCVYPDPNSADDILNIHII